MSQGGGGISASEVYSIARSVAESTVAPVERQVARLESEVSELGSRVRELEAEMGRVASELQDMHRSLTNGLREVASEMGNLQGVARQQLAAQQEAVERTNLVLGATTAGFAASTLATTGVANKVDRGTAAAAELEYLRQYNDARAPVMQVKEFSGEIAERFAAAVDGVAMNRALYDDHFTRVTAELEQKMRTVGEHIFRVVEQDFEPAVATRVEVPRMKYHEVALVTDVERARTRGRELESDLGKTFAEVVQPLLSMQAELEQVLADRYALDGAEAGGTVAVPFDVVISGGGTRVACDADVVAHAGRLALRESQELAPVREAITARAGDFLGGVPLRTLHPEELEQVVQALHRLAAQGRISQELLPGYEEALRERSLQVLDERAAGARD
ncbi:MAG: hypothetical protein RL653_41 [Pseudomonadota bacterium]|jgi:hypothetical protein